MALFPCEPWQDGHLAMMGFSLLPPPPHLSTSLFFSLSLSLSRFLPPSISPSLHLSLFPSSISLSFLPPSLPSSQTMFWMTLWQSTSWMLKTGRRSAWPSSRDTNTRTLKTTITSSSNISSEQFQSHTISVPVPYHQIPYQVSSPSPIPQDPISSEQSQSHTTRSHIK